MIIAGAGGHALELLDLLISEGMSDGLYFFDDVSDKKIFQDNYPIISTESDLIVQFESDPRFILGTGNPNLREMFHKRFLELGGRHLTLQSSNARISNYAFIEGADVFSGCFLGPNTFVGVGSFLNTGCQIHHEVKLGKFVEVNPGAKVLGAASVGDFSTIGTNATVLPKIKIGRNVKIGAGAVVTKDVPDGVKVVGVPGSIL
jgi:sugar O-acyltransferase (sialic acid O-acetyltransferase NeuD family)